MCRESYGELRSTVFIGKRLTVSVFTVLLLLLMLAVEVGAQPDSSRLVQERLRQRIEATSHLSALGVGDEPIFASILLPGFYERRGFSPGWVTDTGPRPHVADLIDAVSRADEEGLRSEDYHLDRIRSLYAGVSKGKRGQATMETGALVDLELLCTDAFFIYGSHLLWGRINPETVDAEWFASRREADLADVLDKALEDRSVGGSLAGLMPRSAEYRSLKQALARYRFTVQEGGWGAIPEGPALKKGDTGDRVVALCRRLRSSGDLAVGERAHDSSFSDSVYTAVVRFQLRYGLDADGVVGPATLAALNTSADERARQIVTNLERWRWLPQELDDRYILVNIADFKLDVIENDSLVLTMPVIVGRSYRRTPVFSDRVSYLVLNPYWHVPPSLAAKDILPAVKKNRDYLQENDFEVFLGWGSDATAIDPGTIDWASVSGKNLRYRFRQKPGQKNALGRVKFMFPNQFNVYLHDTPARGLFAKAKRDFSSGCIRIAKPMELTEYLLLRNSNWTPARIASSLDLMSEQTIRLPASVPIHILYWTAWADDDGTIYFREDIYERDRPLWEALQEEPPAFGGQE